MKVKDKIGLYLLVALLSYVAICIFVYLKKPVNTNFHILTYLACSGGIGGTIYCIRGLYQNIADDSFHPKWVWWYIFRPLMSSCVGVITYFLIVGGLLSISSGKNIDLQKGTMLYTGIAFLSGYSFTKFTEKLDNISSTIFGKEKEKK